MERPHSRGEREPPIGKQARWARDILKERINNHRSALKRPRETVLKTMVETDDCWVDVLALTKRYAGI